MSTSFVLKVLLPAVMDIMGWSDASIAKRCMHVPRELVTAIAAEVGALMWSKYESVMAVSRGDRTHHLQHLGRVVVQVAARFVASHLSRPVRAPM